MWLCVPCFLTTGPASPALQVAMAVLSSCHGCAFKLPWLCYRCLLVLRVTVCGSASGGGSGGATYGTSYHTLPGDAPRSVPVRVEAPRHAPTSSSYAAPAPVFTGVYPVLEPTGALPSGSPYVSAVYPSSYPASSAPYLSAVYPPQAGEGAGPGTKPASEVPSWQ